MYQARYKQVTYRQHTINYNTIYKMQLLITQYKVNQNRTIQKKRADLIIKRRKYNKYTVTYTTWQHVIDKTFYKLKHINI